MATTPNRTVSTGIVVDLPSLSTNLPSDPHPEVLRDNVVSTLKNLLHDNVYAVAVEGPEGIGKTTVLSQFVRRTPRSAISIFVSAANRLSYDTDLIRIDITTQVYWAVTGDVLDRTKYDPPLLKSYYSDLQRLAKQRREVVYFVIDGIEEFDSSDQQLLTQQLQDILPMGIPQFRFVFSGDESIYRSLLGTRLLMKSFPLTEFGLDETRTLFSSHGLTIEAANEINNICRGMPGRLTGVLRAMDRGISPNQFVQDTPTEFFEVDWKQVDLKDANLIRILALLAHDLKPHTVGDIGTILEMPEEQIRDRLRAINFMIVEPTTENVRFANAGLRRYVAERLKDKKVHIQKLLIKRLIATPTSQESVLELPEYLEEAAQFQDLLDLLTPDHILRILERSQTLSRVADTVLRGFRSAKKLDRDADLLRFGIQKSIIAELAAANIWESEVAALTALNRDAEALALANNAVLREDRLQMLAALAHGVWLRGDTVQPELLDQISLLIDNPNYWSLGRHARNIASKLICVSPDLATTLLKKAKSPVDDDDIDRTFAHVTLTALRDLKDERRRAEAIESVARTRQDPFARDLLEAVNVLSGRLSPADVCERSNDIQQEEAKITILRYWCLRNGNVKDADLVAAQALRVALATTSAQIDSSLLSHLSRALPGAPDANRKKELIAAFDGVRASAERLGPSVDYVRLQLGIALAEVDVDPDAAEARLIETLDYVARIGDLPSRGEAYAAFLGHLRMLPSTAPIISKDLLEQQCGNELESVVLMLAESTADHYLALGGIISALAPGFVTKALDYTRVVNTELRRDAVLIDVVRALVQRPVAEIDLGSLSTVLQRIARSESRDQAVLVIMERFEDETAINSNQIDALLPIISSLFEMRESVMTCRALVCALKVLHRASPRHDSFVDHILLKLRTRWDQIDIGWVRIDTGFGIARDLASFSPDEANAILTASESLKSDWRIAAHRPASAYVRCIRLTIRTLCGLLPRHFEKENDIDSLAALIEILPSHGEKAVLWADVCMRTALVGRLDLTERLAQKYLQPAFADIPEQDAAYRERVLIQIAPGLYRAQPTTCLEELNKIDADSRDIAIRQIIQFLLFNRVPSDPVDRIGWPIARTTYDTLLNVESLAARLTTDWMIFETSREVADALQSPENRYTINTPQREDIARRFSSLAESKLPFSRHINHPGYRIITLAQALRMRQAKSPEWIKIIQDAEALENVSDRVFVLQFAALSFPKNMGDQREQLLHKARQLVASIPWDLDQIERYIGLAEHVRDINSSLCRDLVNQAASVINESSDDLHEQQRRLVDVAFRVDEELAKKLIDAFDDDEAKRRAQSQLKILEIKKAIAENVGTADPPKALEHIRGSEISKLGWTLVRALSAGRVQSYHPRDIRHYLELAAEQPLDRAYSVLLWYVDNVVVRYSETDQAATFLRPMFNACVVGAQLAGQIAGRALIRLKALKLQSKTLTSFRSLLVRPESKEAAIRILSDWFERNLSDEVKIHDQYFGPDDLHWLQLIRTARPKSTITVMTSRLHQPAVPAGEALEDVYVNAWRRSFDQSPPKTEIAVIGGEKTKESPIHDRWLVSGSSGLRLGTSFNSLGMTKDSEISEMSMQDSEQKRAEIEQYLTRERTEYKGEQLRLTRFWLT